MRIVRRMFSRRWILTTLLVMAGSAVCVRLGIWQLDRLDQRRAFNAHYLTVRAEAPLDLNQNFHENLESMEYREAFAQGHYDFENQVALRNQYHGNEYGYHLLTPLMLADNLAVLVDRGWIPAEPGTNPSQWKEYDEPDERSVEGIIRLGRSKPQMGGIADPTLAPNQTALVVWNAVNLQRIDEQLPYRLLPVYLQLAPESKDTTPPIPYQPEVEISEGPHLGYAGQWFTFAALLFIGYPMFYLRKQEK